MYKIAICEDHKEHQDHVKKLLKSEKCPELNEVYTFDSGEMLVEAYRANERFTIILLDMEMNQLNGIETAEIIREFDNKVVIIIITSILEYAVEGYTVNAFDFILKPINEDKFYKTVGNAINRLSKDENEVYPIQMRDVTKVIKLADIMYFESNKKKVNIFCRDGTLTSNENISKIESKYSHKGFIRISRFYLLNVKYIREIGLEEIMLINGKSIRYSSKTKNKIIETYMNFVLGDE